MFINFNSKQFHVSLHNLIFFKFKQFKERVIKRLPESYMKTDFYLIRWLRARNYNLQSAQDMLFEVNKVSWIS